MPKIERSFFYYKYFMHVYDWVISFFFNVFFLRTLCDLFLHLPHVFSGLKGGYRLNTGLTL